MNTTRVTVIWIKVRDRLPIHGMPVWAWHEFWIDEDFNPEGIREGFYNDEGSWTTCGWDPCNDVYTTCSDIPMRWAYRKGPKP